MNNNNSSTTDIQPAAGTYHSNKFEIVNQKLREHFQLANKEMDKVKEKVNELVVIVHRDNKDWSIKKICDYIAGKNDDFEELRFSTRTVYNYLNDESRKLLNDTGRPRRMID
jgi:IS30 family transposase